MANTVIIEYTDIFQSVVTTVLVGLHPTISVTNPAITSPISYFVTATVLTEVPLLSTITLSATVVPFSPTKTIISTGFTIFQPGIIIPPTTIPAIQVPLQTITSSNYASESSPNSSGTSPTSAPSHRASPTSSTSTPTPGPRSDTGAIAGAAVGGLIGGALIASLLIWLFMSFRRKKWRPRGGFAGRRSNSRNVNMEIELPG
jgi:hypothetical protein